MTQDPKAIFDFLEALRISTRDQTMIKCSLGDPVADGPVRKILGRLITLKNTLKLSLTFRTATQDTVKNFSIEDGLSLLQENMQQNFRAGSLSTQQFDLTLSHRAGLFFLKKTNKSKHNSEISLQHDKKKTYRFAPSTHGYLHALGITDQGGKVIPKSRDKFLQITRYIEGVAPHLERIGADHPLRVYDMGCGKGYLTFALYDYLKQTHGKPPVVIGIEQRDTLVDFCNQTARACGFDGLQFLAQTIANAPLENPDILIALHACNTATDQAIWRGLCEKAKMIVVAPCCHKEVRQTLHFPLEHPLYPVSRHGIFEERLAELMTDSLRTLILDYYGYKTVAAEFIGAEHTAKNVMILAIRRAKESPKSDEKYNQIIALMNHCGITSQTLFDLMVKNKTI